MTDTRKAEIEALDTKVDGIALDLDELIIPENIPTLHKEDFELSCYDTSPLQQLEISCDEQFELKAVYVHFNDPDGQISLCARVS